MDFSSIISGLSGGGTLLSGLGSALSAFGFGGSNRKDAANAMSAQLAYANRWAEEEIQSKVRGAEKAGLHPLAVLGMPSSSFNAPIVGGDSGMDLERAGQGVARAADAFSDSRMRSKLFEQEVRLNEAKIQSVELANAASASDLAVRSAGATVPVQNPSDLLIGGQGNAAIGVTNRVPLPATTKYVSRTGSLEHYPSQEVAEAIEDNPIYQVEHFYRNRIAPFIHSALQPLVDLGRLVGREANDYRYGRKVRNY